MSVDGSEVGTVTTRDDTHRHGMPRVCSLVTDELLANGVRAMFGLIGDENAALVTDVSAAGIRYFGTRHEAAAAGMADGYAWATGDLGVCTVTRGPGITNALTALRAAVQGHRRVLVITGDTPIGDDHFYLKALDQDALCRSVGLEYFPASTVETMVAHLHGALEAARSGRPAVLAVASDLLAQVLDQPPPVRPRSTQAAAPPVGPGDADVARVVELVRGSARPLVIAGRGASSQACRDLLVALAEHTGALLGTTFLAKGLFRGCSRDLGLVGGFAADPSVALLGDVDLVLAFGASLNRFTTAGRSLFAGAPIVHVDTGSTLQPSVPVELTIRADAELTAARLVEAFAAEPMRAAGGFDEHALARLGDPPFGGADHSNADGLDPHTVATTFDELLPEDRVVILDAGLFMNGPGRFVGVREPESIRHTMDGGAIGLGVGVALGAAVGRPERTTVLFAGDGGVGMALADLENAARHRIPIIIVVLDDRAFGAELHHFLLHEGLPGEHGLLPPLDFTAVAQALGIDAVTVRTPAELRDLASRLAAPSKPLLVHCPIRRDVTVPLITWGERSRSAVT